VDENRDPYRSLFQSTEQPEREEQLVVSWGLRGAEKRERDESVRKERETGESRSTVPAGVQVCCFLSLAKAERKLQLRSRVFVAKLSSEQRAHGQGIGGLNVPTNTFKNKYKFMTDSDDLQLLFFGQNILEWWWRVMRVSDE
jgi:hypothetical protein